MEFFAQCCWTKRAEFGAELFVSGGTFEHAVNEEFDVEVCAAHHYGQNILLATVFDRAFGLFKPVAGVEAFADGDEVDQEMVDLGTLFTRGLGARDVQSLIDLKRVGGEDCGFSAASFECTRDAQGEFTFAASGWAAEDRGWDRFDHEVSFARKGLNAEEDRASKVCGRNGTHSLLSSAALALSIPVQ